MDHGQPQLGWVHGNIYPDRVGHAEWPGESIRHSSRHHVCLPLPNSLSAVVRKTDEAVARPYIVWGEDVDLIEWLLNGLKPPIREYIELSRRVYFT